MIREIPRVIHAVWVGTSPPPWILRRWGLWERWCAERDIEFRTWSNDEVDSLPMTSQLPPLPHPVVKADFARVEIVNLYGGMYVDSDTVPLPGSSAEDLLGNRPGWVARLFNPHKVEFNNGCFAFAPASPFLERVWHIGVRRIDRGYVKMSSIIGPPVWTKVAEEMEGSFEGMAPDRFYTPMDLEHRTLEDLAMRHPECLLVHEFEQSWQRGYDGHGLHKPIPKWERRMSTSMELEKS